MDDLENVVGRVKISVRSLVEFILQSGDLDNSQGTFEPDAMQEGTRLHKKIQKSMGRDYAAEVSMSLASKVEYDGEVFEITVEGRADGVISLISQEEKISAGIETQKDAEKTESSKTSETVTNGPVLLALKPSGGVEVLEGAEEQPVFSAEKEELTDCQVLKESEKTQSFSLTDKKKSEVKRSSIVIDEIKCVCQELSSIKEMRPVHRAQAMCYASQYAIRYGHKRIGIQLTYCNIQTEKIKRFEEEFSHEELVEWYHSLLLQYAKWVSWQHRWSIVRDASMKQLAFPFQYRPGQKELAASVYRTILREKNIFIEAPTGVGKTISTLFPAIKADRKSVV